MRASKVLLILAATGIFILWSCTKETIEKKQTIVYDNVIYRVDTIPVYQNALQKTRQKTPTQYLSVLYMDFMQKQIPIKELNNLTMIALSIGDKKLFNEMAVRYYLSQAIIPTDAEMRKDIPKFITTTYLKFYLRKPTQTELYYLKDIIAADAKMTPTNLYTAFALSNEYLYY